MLNNIFKNLIVFSVLLMLFLLCGCPEIVDPEGNPTDPPDNPTAPPPPPPLEYPAASVITNYMDPGPDGIWFNEDDIIAGYEIREYHHYYSDSARNYAWWNGGQGQDGEWFTEDDIPFGWWWARSDSCGSWHEDPGSDGIWFNSDDTIHHWEDLSATPQTQYDDPGNDGEWFTGDDVISAYYKDKYDENGNLIMRVTYKDPGNDGIWFTTDDVVSDEWFGYYWLAEYEGENNRWWSWTKQIRFGGPGYDGEWFTGDDMVRDFRTHEFGDGNKFFTKETAYNDPGPDNTMFTPDDVVSEYSLAVNYYDTVPTQEPTATPDPEPTPVPLYMIQDFEYEDITPDGAMPFNVWGNVDGVYTYDGDSDGNGTGTNKNEITAFAITADGAGGTSRSTTVCYTIGDNDASPTSYDGYASAGYSTYSGFPVDLSFCEGLHFYAKGTTITSLLIAIRTTEQKALSEYNSYIASVEMSGTWQSFTIPWTSFIAPDWGNNIPPLDPSQIEDIAFYVEEGSGIQTAGEFSLDELSVYVTE